ncbi:MAG: gamma-glutamyl-gamma-aminobutyrate hydrolase family protein, partial [Patescibacteria group bacterium]
FLVVTLYRLQDSSLASYDGVIISGAPIILGEVSQREYLEPFQRMKEMTQPILGICLGHQILGLLFGSQIHRGSAINREEDISIVKPDELFSGLENPVSFREDHSEYVTVPEGFTLLAKSGSCENEAMKHQEKRMYGVQFHPEVSGSNGDILLGNFMKICSPVS